MKVGIAGRGFMGTMHLNCYADIPDAEVMAVCPGHARGGQGNIASAKNRVPAPQFASARTCANWQELVELPELDAIDICLPTDLHREIAVAALRAGKHVLCEKPMALTLEDCEHMMAAAEKHNRILMVAQVLRFWPEYRYLEQFVKSGSCGRIRSALFIRSCGIPDWSPWLMDESRSGGAVIDLLIHDLDQALLLFGIPDRVAAKSIAPVDTLMGTLIYPNGPEVRIQGGWFPAGAKLSMSFQVRADHAELEWTARGLTFRDGTGKQTTIEPEADDGYSAEITYFLDCCRANKQPERCLPRESARALQVARALKESRAAGGEQMKCSV